MDCSDNSQNVLVLRFTAISYKVCVCVCFQGSESEVLVYVVGSPMYQTWQHVYTAVTRGRKKVILITTDEALRGAINRKPYRRFTGLRNNLEKRFAKLSERSENLPAKCETPDGPTFQSLRSKFDPRGSRSPFQVKDSFYIHCNACIVIDLNAYIEMC